jgi:hypothetical protein
MTPTNRLICADLRGRIIGAIVFLLAILIALSLGYL